jgi:hypothetical protein
MGYEQLNKRGRLYEVDFGRQPCFAFALVCWPGSTRRKFVVHLVRSNLLLSLILFLPDPVRCTRLASSWNRALDEEPEMEDLDKGDRVFEAELVRDDLEGVCCGGGIFS